jgi:hypothetical protein
MVVFLTGWACFESIDAIAKDSKHINHPHQTALWTPNSLAINGETISFNTLPNRPTQISIPNANVSSRSLNHWQVI